MTWGEKLSKLRKENNITQEQLADTLGVSRQSVSKWESGLAYPETEKLIRIGAMFQCSLDYLLKEEVLESAGGTAPVSAVRRVSREDASRFLAAKAQTAWPTAIATLLCIISPVCLLLLSAVSELPRSHLDENIAAGIGMIVLLLLVGCAVVIFILTGKKTDAFHYLDREPFETEHGVCEWVRERMEQFRPVYTRYNAAGVFLCILSAVPLFAGMIARENDNLLMAAMFCLLLGAAGAGVLLLVRAGTVWSGFQQLLQEGEYSRAKKGGVFLFADGLRSLLAPRCRRLSDVGSGQAVLYDGRLASRGHDLAGSGRPFPGSSGYLQVAPPAEIKWQAPVPLLERALV